MLTYTSKAILMPLMKNYLSRSAFLNTVNTKVKSYFQEQKARKGIRFYQKEAKTLSCPVEKKDIATALKKRLLDRGINPNPKRKGELHIFVTFALCNWEGALPLALQSFGKVTIFDWRHLLECKGRDSIDAEMIKAFNNAYLQKPVDAVVGYLSGYATSPQALLEIANKGTVIFNFCWDDKLNFPGTIIEGRYSSPAAIASAVDLNLTNAPESVVKYAVHGGLSMFWPEAAHPDIHKPYDIPFEFDVSFVGGKYGWRPEFIKRLRRYGINVECFGNGWENGPLSDEEMVKLYSRSRINLGFAGVGHSKKLMCLKGRDFEVPMSGGLYLTQDNPEFFLVYDVCKEIVTYKNEKDCAGKIKWLLANPDEADKIRKAGRKRSLRDHRWEKRFEDIFRLAGIMEE